MRLIDAPVGLFMSKEGELCLKTEYIADWGVEAYIVSSGETYWGGAKTAEGRNNLDVTPVDAVPETEAELKHLINDTIAYIWRLEDRGCDKPEFGYDSRKALLEKLKQFYKEHFQENGCSCGEQKDGEG